MKRCMENEFWSDHCSLTQLTELRPYNHHMVISRKEASSKLVFLSQKQLHLISTKHFKLSLLFSDQQMTILDWLFYCINVVSGKHLLDMEERSFLSRTRPTFETPHKECDALRQVYKALLTHEGESVSLARQSKPFQNIWAILGTCHLSICHYGAVLHKKKIEH